MDNPLLVLVLFGVTLSGAVCALSAWAFPARDYDADGSPRGFPGAGLAFALGVGAATYGLADESWRDTAVAIVLTTGALFLIGTATERMPVAMARPIRWSVLIPCALLLAQAGVAVTEVKVPFGPVVSLGSWGPVLSALWLFVVAFLITLSNRGEALVPGIAVLSSLTLTGVAALAGSGAVSVPKAAVLGFSIAAAGLPVLLWCRPPAKVRFGMGGGMAAGMALAALSILGAVKHAAFLVLVVPALCLGGPLLAAWITFALNRDRPLGSFLGEAERVTFVGALVRRGMTPVQAVTFLLAWHLYLCAVALLLAVAIRQSWLLKLAVLVVLGAVGVVAFAVTFQIVYGWRMERGGTALRGIRILGTFVHRTTMEDALEHVFLWAGQSRLHHIVTADATLVERASREPELAAIIDQASLVTPDGAGVLFAARLLGAPFPERVAGVDLTRGICRRAAERKVPVYLLGAQPAVISEAAERLRSASPGLDLAGVRDGYFTAEEESEVARAIAESGARILLVGLGVPHQERFIHRNRAALGVGVVMGVGGTFDVISGRVIRAPVWMQSIGLEWLWRVMRDPRRLPRLIALPRFFGRVMVHTIRTRGLGRTAD